VNPADRVALLERLARANAWLDLTEDQRQTHRKRAAALLDETRSPTSRSSASAGS
jgi:hypothetical protein